MAIRDVLVALIVFGSLPFIFLRPQVGIYMWAWLSYMNPHRMTWGFAYEFPFAQAVALVLLIGFVLSKDRRTIPLTSVSSLWMILIVWMCITTVFALNPGPAVTEWSNTMKIQLLALMTVVLIYEKKALHTFAWVVTLSIVFFGFKGGIFILMHGGSGKVYGPPDSYFEDNNALALTLLMVLPLLIFLTRSVRENIKIGAFSISAKAVRLFLWTAAAMSTVSVIFTYSRGAFLTVAAMTGLALIKMKRRLILIAALVIAVPLAIAYVPDKWFDRMQTIETYEEDTSATGRINAWWFAYNLAKVRPITGGGFETFTRPLFELYAPDPEHYQGPHSIYFEMLGEHGYVGLALFLSLGFATYRMAGKVAKQFRGGRPGVHQDDAWIGEMAVALQFGIAAYSVGGAFLALAYFDLYYHLVGMVLILYRYAQQKMSEHSADGIADQSARTLVAES